MNDDDLIQNVLLVIVKQTLRKKNIEDGFGDINNHLCSVVGVVGS